MKGIIINTILESINEYNDGLSKEDHEISLNVPVEYVNFPPEMILVSSPEAFLEVRVKTSGFSALFYNLFNTSKLILDIEKANIKSQNGISEVFWLMNSKPNKQAIQEVLASSMKVQDIETDRLVISFSDKAKKLIPIKLNKSISLKSEIRFVNPIVLVPDSIMIYGDQHQLDQLHFVETEELLLLDVSENSTHNLKLSIPSTVQSKTAAVDVIIEVEPFIEKLLNSKIQVQNLEKGYSLKLFPELVQVILRVPKEKYSMLDTDFLKLYVDASLISNDVTTLKVEIESLPSIVELKRIYPSKVEFLKIKE